MVKDGKLRADLFHRIAALRVTLPPLRERREDIPLLVGHFSTRSRRLSAPAMERLLLHDWPGNVRELRHAVETALSIRAGNMAQVARDLSMSRSTLYEAVERLGIDPGQFRR